MGSKKMVCPCMKVSKEDIVQAIEDGASNFKDIKKKTKIVTKCGKCKNRARCLIREMFAEKDMIVEQEEGVCLGCQGDFFEPMEQVLERKEEPCALKLHKKEEKKKEKKHKKGKECGETPEKKSEGKKKKEKKASEKKEKEKSSKNSGEEKKKKKQKKKKKENRKEGSQNV